MTSQPPRNPFESSRKLNRSERKAMDRAAARRREWEAAQRSQLPTQFPPVAPVAPVALPSLVPPAPAAAPTVSLYTAPSPHPAAAVPGPSAWDGPGSAEPSDAPHTEAAVLGRWHLLAVATAVVLGCAAIGVGAPVLAHPLRPVPFVGFLLAAVLLVRATRSSARALRLRTKAISYTLALVLVSAFAIGATTSVVVDGKVYAVTSPTAKASTVSTMMRDDLRRMAELDALLSYDQATSRANYNKYAPAQQELTDLSAKYSRIQESDVPSAQFLVLAEKIKSAAYFEALAMDGKRKLVLVDDAKLAADTNSYRTTFVETVLTVSPQLRDLAAQYGISLAATQDGPVE